MTNVKLLTATLVGDRHHNAGDIVQMPNDLADAHIKAGMAEKTTETAVDNPKANHLADAISPAPPDGHVQQAISGAGPRKIKEVPGLVELNKAFSAGPPLPAVPKRAGKVTTTP